MSFPSAWIGVATRSSDRRPTMAGTGRGAGATVHSCFRTVLNIATPDGLLTIAPASLGGLPNGLVADLGPDLRERGLKPGMAVAEDVEGISVPAIGWRLDTRGATPWSPRLHATDDRRRHGSARWQRRRAQVREQALRRSNLQGAARLLGDAGDAGVPSCDVHDVAAHLRPSVTALTRRLAADDRAVAARIAIDMIGAGPGLTPSGDDVLVGIEAALHALADPGAGFVGGALDDVDARTTAVGATFLRHAARGEFAERLHLLVGALLGPDDAALPAAIDRAMAWGAWSGTDVLVGVVHGLDVATRRQDGIDR